MHAFSDVVRECMTERYPGIPGGNSREVIKARDDLYKQFKKRRAEGENPKATEKEVDLSIVKQEAVKGPKSSFPVLSTRVEGYPDQISHKGSKIALTDSTNERKEEDHENKR